MTAHPKLRVSPAALLFFAAVFFFDTSGIVSALIPAALVHELGHLLLLKLFHRRLTGLRLGLFGLEMDYAPGLEGWQSLACAAAGPAFGGLFALLACSLGGDFWLVSGAASFLLTCFNLLPVLPLDGGRVLTALMPERTARGISLLAACLLLAGGIAICVRFRSFGLLLAALWLVIWNCTCFFRKADIE